jgi:hypothetical protein
MGHARQGSFFKSNKFQYQHGGELRRKRAEKFHIAKRGSRGLRQSRSTNFGSEARVLVSVHGEYFGRRLGHRSQLMVSASDNKARIEDTEP